MTPVVRLLCDLIEIPSVNPGLCPDQPELTGEEDVAKHLIGLASKAGLTVERQAVLPGRDNLLVRMPPKGDVKKRIILAPHMDTVPVMSMGQFKAELKDGRIYGRGACDTKSCIATYFQTLLDLTNEADLSEHTEILFLGLVDEEVNQSGSRVFGESEIKGDLAIVGEPTELEVVIAHKGNFWINLSVKGKAAHGAAPHLGENAVHRMSKIVDVLLTDYVDLLNQRSHPLLGSPTINIGQIKGGTQPNIVPDLCSISIDRRTIPGETAESVYSEIHTLLNQHGLADREMDEIRKVPCHPLDTSPDHPLIQDLLAATRCSKGKGVHYFSDASPISQGGTPTVLYGPGSISQAHTADEWIEVEQMETAAKRLKRFLVKQL
jgi:acetylornithine deacetylase/succinyl-diaminopimelate desuccinylase family protein